ncbi:type II toxin-antitoxin system VapC family toxin [Candidatus Amesbacteria bacterium]|nr:type II toxin-antitoxin system VapC family toxin [Candidatus Amesbacteria bacterium]
MIVDSTVLVDAVRGNKKAGNFLESVDERLLMSRAGEMELTRGARTKRDLKVIDKFLKVLNVEVVEISEEISKQAGQIFRSFWHSHGIGAMDAFIAATALVLGESVVTHNVKHFKFIKGLDLIVPY